MPLLQSIWWTSLALAGLSVVMMSVLILGKVRILKNERWWKKRKGEIAGRIMECLDAPADAPLVLQVRDRRDVRLVTEIAYELSGSVRGETRRRLTDLLEEVGGWEANIALLKSAKERLRVQAVESLTLFSGENVKHALMDVLQDPSQNVRFTAAKALIDIDAELTVSDLIEKLDIGGKVTPRALRGIFRKIAPGSVPELLEIVKGDYPEAVKLLAIDALGHCNDFTLIPAIAALVDSPSVNVRAEAFRALTTLGHPSALPVVLKGLSDASWVIRAQAAICAGRIGLGETLPALAGLLGDGKWWVRYRAASALKQLGEDGIEVLMNVSKDETQGARAAKTAQMVLLEEKPR